MVLVVKWKETFEKKEIIKAKGQRRKFTEQDCNLLEGGIKGMSGKSQMPSMSLNFTQGTSVETWGSWGSGEGGAIVSL